MINLILVKIFWRMIKKKTKKLCKNNLYLTYRCGHVDNKME